jgi:hypothetical protein
MFNEEKTKMRKLFLAMSVVAFAMVGVVITPNESAAVPSFARQTGNSCLSCHFQHIPKLSAMGRAFKLGGYTDTTVDLIEDDNLSIPANMPLSFISKIRYQVTTAKNESKPEKKGTERGEWQIPDEGAIFMGGRVGANVGYLMEWPGSWAAGKVVFKKDVGDNTLGVVVYSTEGGGPAFGQELFSTGFYAASRSFEEHDVVPSFQNGVTGGAAQGLTFYAGGANFFAAAGLFAPVFEAADGALDLSIYYRLALTGEVAGGDAEIGIIGMSGETKCVECAEIGPNADESLQTFKTESFGVDADWQGELENGMTLELQATYTSVGDTSGNVYVNSDGFGFIADLGINPEWVLKAAYSTYTDKSGSSDVTKTTTGLGVVWNIYQNLTLRVEYSIYGDDGGSNDNKTTVMLFSGF